MSPEVFNLDGIKGAIYFNDHADQPHVHVYINGHSAKFIFANTVRLWVNYNMTPGEIRQAIEMIRRHKGHCWRVWHSIYGDPAR